MNYPTPNGFQPGSHSTMTSQSLQYRNPIQAQSAVDLPSSLSNYTNTTGGIPGSVSTYPNSTITSQTMPSNSYDALNEQTISSMAQFMQQQQQQFHHHPQQIQSHQDHRYGQQQSFNGFPNASVNNIQQQMTWPNMVNSSANSAQFLNVSHSYTNPTSDAQDILRNLSLQSDSTLQPAQSNSLFAHNAGYPLLSNAITSSPSSMGMNSPMMSSASAASASNIIPAMPYVPGTSPALLNTLMSQSTSQTNSIVGTPSDGSVHSSSGYNSLSDQKVATTNQDGQIAKPKRSSVGGSTAGTTRRIKFRRSRTGCLVCRKRKVKCDQDGLPCKQCRFGKRDCHYEENPAPKRRRKPVANSTIKPEESEAELTKSHLNGKAKRNEESYHSASEISNNNFEQINLGNLQQYPDPQSVFEKLRQAALNNPSVSGTECCSSNGENDSKEPSEHWAAGHGSVFGAFNRGTDGEWNTKSPSTGATSLHTVDGGELVGSNTSSRRVTLSDDRFENFDLSSIPNAFDCNQLSREGVEMFTGFPNVSTSLNFPADGTAGNQTVPGIDRKTSLSPLHMDAMHNRITANFDPTTGIRHMGQQPGR